MQHHQVGLWGAGSPMHQEWPQEAWGALAPSTSVPVLLHPGSVSLLSMGIVAFIGTTAVIALFEWRLLMV